MGRHTDWETGRKTEVQKNRQKYTCRQTALQTYKDTDQIEKRQKQTELQANRKTE